MPLVSIVLPTYNGSRYIQQSIDSCLQQTFPDLELIVVDGGSYDSTVELVQKYEDPRVRLLDQPNNRGRLPGAINLGLEHALSTYLTWTSDDNTYDPEALAMMVCFLDNHPEVDWVYAGYRRVDEYGRLLTISVTKPPEVWLPRGINSPCFLFRRHVYEAIGGQDIGLPLAADFEYWLRAWKSAFRMHPLESILYTYRVHPNSLTGRLGPARFLRDTEKALTRWLGPNPYLYPSRYARLVAENYISNAFETYQAGNLALARSNILRALLYDPRWFSNRGVASILFRSLIKRGVRGNCTK